MARLFWTQKQDFGPVARTIHAMTYDSSRERVVLFAGSVSAAVMANDTWESDGEYWTLVHTLGPSPRGGLALAFDSARAGPCASVDCRSKQTRRPHSATLGNGMGPTGPRWQTRALLHGRFM